MKKMFTEEGLARLRPPPTGRVEYGDSVVAGLMLRVTANGVKTWSVLYKVKGEGGASPLTGRMRKGTQRRITLGTFPVLGVNEARELAIDVLQKAWSGSDTRLLQREAHAARQANTVEIVARRFIEQDAKRNVASWRKIERSLELHVLPKWGPRAIAEIRRRDVHDLLDEFVARGLIGTARDVRKHLSRLFNWAVDREIVVESPLAGVKRKDLQYRAEAGRALTDDELRCVWRGAARMPYPFGPYFQLLVLTGQRRNDWANARHSEICPRRKALEIPRARYKGRRDHVVPLAPAAWAIYEAMPEWVGADPYLFSTQAGEVAVCGFSKAKAQLDALATEELRRIRDAVLGHAKVGLQRTYNKHDYADEKRAALEAYAAHVMEVVGDARESEGEGDPASARTGPAAVPLAGVLG